MTMKKVSLWVLAEICLVLALWLLLKNLLKSTGMNDLQTPIFGAALISSALLFFALPTLVSLLVRRNTHAVAYDFANWRQDFRSGRLAISYVFPACVLFPVVTLVGSTPEEWIGALILTIGFSITGWLYVTHSCKDANTPGAQINGQSLGICIALLTIGLLVCYLVNPFAPLLANAIRLVLFVGFLEEFFFRGYVQTRLNDYFGKPFNFQNVDFGMGLVIAAIVFGVFHPITVIENTPWPWALWTAALGLVLGFLREKTNSIVAPSVLHSVIILPTLFFGAT